MFISNKLPIDAEALGSHGLLAVFGLQDIFPQSLALYIVLKNLFKIFFISSVPTKDTG